MNKKIITGLLVVFLSFTQSAYAGIPVIDGAVVASVQMVNAAISAMSGTLSSSIQTVNSSVNTMSQNLKEAIKTNGDNTVNAINGMTNYIMDQNKAIMEANNTETLNTAKKVQLANTLVTAQPVAGYCGTRGAPMARQRADEAAKLAAIGRERARSAGYGKAVPPANQLDQALGTHKGAYCSQHDVELGMTGCGASEVATATAKGLNDADAKASSLFSGAGAPEKTKAATGVAKPESLTFDAEQQAAAQSFIANVADNGDVPRRLSRAEANTPQGNEYEALRIVYLARSSTPSAQLATIAARRDPIKGSGQMMKDRFGGNGQSGGGGDSYSVGFFKKMFTTPADVSALQIMDFENKRRYANPDWYQGLTQMPEAALLREIATEMAVLINYQYEELKDREMASTLAATQALDSLKTNMLPRLKQAEAGAAAAASSGK